LLKNMAAKMLALVIAQPTKICQKSEMTTLDVRNNSFQNTVIIS
jgi:hypothetical protein